MEHKEIVFRCGRGAAGRKIKNHSRVGGTGSMVIVAQAARMCSTLVTHVFRLVSHQSSSQPRRLIALTLAATRFFGDFGMCLVSPAVFSSFLNAAILSKILLSGYFGSPLCFCIRKTKSSQFFAAMPSTFQAFINSKVENLFCLSSFALANAVSPVLLQEVG